MSRFWERPSSTTGLQKEHCYVVWSEGKPITLVRNPVKKSVKTPPPTTTPPPLVSNEPTLKTYTFQNSTINQVGPSGYTPLTSNKITKPTTTSLPSLVVSVNGQTTSSSSNHQVHVKPKTKKRWVYQGYRCILKGVIILKR